MGVTDLQIDPYYFKLKNIKNNIITTICGKIHIIYTHLTCIHTHY